MEMTLVPDAIDDDAPSRDTDNPPIRCQMEGCTNAVTKPARGRTPKYCDEHRNQTKSTKGRSASWANANAVEKALAGYLNGLGMAVSFVNPDDGKVIASGAEPIAHEIVEIARNDKKLRAKLEMITAPGKYGKLALAVAPVIIGLMANHNLLPQFVIGDTGGRES